ncbi:DUF342 domain-containing protein [Thermosulfurimonas sp. F29]|uniref:DUF342 domain-containing protein n=1 Tax=Thermosulfurimonas sp. F29 TaxID=2867247 RepID=UPI001C8368B8|nr:FapA family protein [Thermosulfurimonas sp. F29]MBX6422536.1 FapA family protein [Thermosulfurimonas sp. F29]
MGVREEARKKGYPLNDRYVLRVSPDEMEAWLEGGMPEEKEWPKLRQSLSELGLSGLLEHPEPTPDGWVIVARGKPPVPGQDGRLEFLVDLSHGPRKIDKYRVDLREMNLVVSVQAGTPVLRRIPPQPGQPGYNVWGEVLTPPPVKDVEFNYGEGLRPDEGNQVLIAERDGCLVEKQGKLAVEPTYTLEGDVDWDSGNVRFYGEKLTVTGSVRRGFKVLAKGEVEIQGGVEDEAEIEIEGNLSVGGLVHGAGTVVRVSGNAVLGSVEYARVEVEGDLTVRDYVLQARLKVGKHLEVMEGRGLVAAGEITVGEDAILKVAGNDSYVPTRIGVGSPPRILEEIDGLRSELVLLDEVTEKLRKAIALGLKLKKEGKLTPKKAKILAKLQKVFGEKMLAQADLQEKLKEKENILQAQLKYTLRVLEKVYPGVIIAIGRYEYRIKEEIPGPVEFYWEENKVKSRPL